MGKILKNKTNKTISKIEFEKLDYEISASLLENYSNMRLVALGGAITLVVGIMSFSPDNDGGIISKVMWNALILLSVFISIRIIASINSNLYARCLHMEWLENKFEKIGFFTYWDQYVLDKSINATSNAFLISCVAFNWVDSLLYYSCVSIV